MDDLCRCGHEMIDHRELGCEDCMCEQFVWPVDPLIVDAAIGDRLLIPPTEEEA